MDLVDRDTYILNRLNTLKAQGMTDGAAVLEIARTAGDNFIFLPAMDHVGMVTDIAGLQTAVSDLANLATRATASAMLASIVAPSTAGKRIVQVPRPPSVNSTDHYRHRALAAGA